MTTFARAVAVVASCNARKLRRHARHKASSGTASRAELGNGSAEVLCGEEPTKVDSHIRTKGWVTTSVVKTRTPEPGETINKPKAAVAATPALVPQAQQRGR